MILIDTSVWVDHLRRSEQAVADRLMAGRVLIHPFIVGELALGSLRDRGTVISSLQNLPQSKVATDTEVLIFIESSHLAGTGIGYIDAHLLAATRLTPGASLWTRDKRLDQIAARLGIGTDPLH